MITEQIYKLDTFLSSVEDYSIFDFLSVKINNEYPKLPKIVKEYRKRLEESFQQPQYDEFLPPKNDKDIIEFSEYWKEQSYVYQMSMPIGDDFYNITWSIPKAKKVIETYNLEQMYFYVKFIADGSSPGAVEMEYLEKARRNTDPIIAIQYPLLTTKTQTIVIDGNHRLAARIEDNEEFILGYLLNPDQQFKALAGELDRVIYTVHNNLGMIIEYMIGNITKTKLKKYIKTF